MSFLNCYVPKLSGDRVEPLLSHIYMPLINILNEWKICYVIYAVPFKGYIETWLTWFSLLSEILQSTLGNLVTWASKAPCGQTSPGRRSCSRCQRVAVIPRHR